MANVPKVRFKGFTDEWEEHPIGSLYIKNLEKNNNQFLSDKTISIAGMKYKPEGNGADEQSITNYKVLRVNDIAFEGHTNKTYSYGRFVLNDVGNGIMSPRFTTLRPLHHGNTDFWKHLFKSEQIMGRILAKSTKLGTMMNELVYEDLAKNNISIPAVSEQNIIGNFLKNIDTFISLSQQNLELKKQLKKAMLQKMFPQKGETVPKLRFDGFDGDWEDRKLGEVSTIIGGGTPNTSNPEYWDGEIDWYAPAEIGEQIYVSKSKKSISKLGQLKSSAKILPVGTVLFTSRAGIGNTAILAKEATTNQGFQSIIPDKNKLDTYFIFSKTNELKRYGEVNGAGSTFVEVSGKQMAKMPIMLPTLPEQKKIGAFFKSLDDQITELERQLEHTKQMKKALLQKMFV